MTGSRLSAIANVVFFDTTKLRCLIYLAAHQQTLISDSTHVARELRPWFHVKKLF